MPTRVLVVDDDALSYERIRKGLGAGIRHGKLRSGLVIAEVALSIVLLTSAGLMMRSFFALTHVDMGFNTAQMLYANVVPTADDSYDTAAKKTLFIEQALRRVKSLPGVLTATFDTVRLRFSFSVKNLPAFFLEQLSLRRRQKQIWPEHLQHDFLKRQLGIFKAVVIKLTNNCKLSFGQLNHLGFSRWLRFRSESVPLAARREAPGD